MQNELQNNTQFLVHQQNFDREKSRKEESERKAAPSGLVRTEDLQKAQMQERQEKAEQKHYQRAQMMNQYSNAVSNKQNERQKELDMARRVADAMLARNHERAQEEAVRASAEKNSYSEYLKTQMQIDRA